MRELLPPEAVQAKEKEPRRLQSISTKIRVQYLGAPTMGGLGKPLDGLKLPYGGGSMQRVLGEKARVLNPCSDAAEKGKSGKGNSVCEKDVGRSHLSMLFGCEICSPPR